MNALLTKNCAGPAPESRRVSLLNVTAHLDPSFGGICAVVPSLCSALSTGSGARVSIAAFCDQQEAMPALENVRVDRYPLGPTQWVRDSNIRRRLSDQVRDSDGIHIHGLWREHCTVAAWLARKWKKPYAVSAHGMLERWALANKGAKKALYSYLFERRNLAQAACLHALTQTEVTDYRRFGLKTPVAIVPNGITIPSHLSAEPFLTANPHLRDRRIVLFLGRIHYKKGVDLLCRAWPAIYRRWPDAHLVIAGPDFENTRVGIETLVKEMDVASSVTFTGMLDAEMKWSALHAAQIFVLPSHSEGLSVSVLEAMGIGVPVVVTEQCNIPEVRRYNCGLVVQPKTGELIEAIGHLLSLDRAAIERFGNAGRQLVRRSYSWETVARQMSQVYQWMLGGQLPSDVEVSRTR